MDENQTPSPSPSQSPSLLQEAMSQSINPTPSEPAESDSPEAPVQNTMPTPGPGEVWRKRDGKCVLITDHLRGGVAACVEATTYRPTAVHPTELQVNIGKLNDNFELF